MKTHLTAEDWIGKREEEPIEKQKMENELTTLRTQLAACQARELRYREALESIGAMTYDAWSNGASAKEITLLSLYLPTDNSELRARCLKVIEAYEDNHRCDANACDQSAPSLLYRPRLFIDGNQWCALYGDNLQDGVAGFGDTPDKAMRNFDLNWCELKITTR